MSWFRRKPKEPELYGWRIITRRNDALDKTVYRVGRDGDFYARRPPQYEDFDDYDEALAYYHEKAGWRTVDEAQP